MVTTSTATRWLARTATPGVVVDRRTRPRLSDGLPTTWASVIDARAPALVGEPVTAVRHQPLSRWKHGGALRIEVVGESGAVGRFVVKDAGSADEVDAVLRPPVRLAEPTLLRNASGALRRHLVELVDEWWIEDEFLLVTEDLGRTHRPAVLDGDLVRAARELPRLHAALADLPAEVRSVLTSSVPDDREVLVALAGHLRGVPLAGAWVERLREEWASLSEQFEATAPPPDRLTPVHGDLNPSNVLVPRTRSGGHVLFVDWEWLTVGGVEDDLASLLKAASPWASARAIRAFRRSGGTFDRDRYLDARFRRALVDAGFLAALASGGQRPAWIDAAVEGAARTAIQAATARRRRSMPK